MGLFDWIQDHEFVAILTTILILLAIGTLFYHAFESLGFLDALYFSTMTLATVGYGDFVPKTAIGKIFTILFVFIGVGLFLAFVNMIAQRRIKSIEKRIKEFNNQNSGGMIWKQVE